MTTAVQQVPSNATLVGTYIEADAWQREITHPDYAGPAFESLRLQAYARVLQITEQFTCDTWTMLHLYRRTGRLS